MTVTDSTPCANCGCAFERHAGFHDSGLGGDGSYVDLGCECGCGEFEPEDEMNKKLMALLATAELDDDQLRGLTRDQLRGLTRDQLSWLTRDQLRGLTGDQLRGLTRDQLRGLTRDQLRGLTRDQLSWLTRDQLRGLTRDQLRGLTRDQLSWLTRDQLRGLTRDQLRGLTRDQLSWLTGDQLRGLTRDQLSWLTGDQLRGLTRDQLSWLTGDQLSWLTGDQLSWLTGDQLRGLTRDQLRGLTGAGAPKVERLYSRMAAEIKAEQRRLDQATFGPSFDPGENLCKTPMCIAGHTVHLAGPEGYKLAARLGFAGAATLIHRASRPDAGLPRYDGYPNEWALAYIEARAKEEAKPASETEG